MTDSQSVERTSSGGRRQQLLDAAQARFVRDGYAHTPVSAIVGDAGVAQGTFYLYFRSKQDVLTELRRAVFRDYASGLRQTCRLKAPADERLARILPTMAAAVRRNRDLERVFRAAESAEATERAALEGRARLARAAAELVDEGIRARVFTPHPRPELTAHFFVTLFDHVLYEALEYRAPADLDEVVAHGNRFILNALGVTAERTDELVRLAHP